MSSAAEIAAEAEVWGPYVVYDDVARFEYGRRLWRPGMRAGCCGIGSTNGIRIGTVF
jgi:hypothetical protein